MDNRDLTLTDLLADPMTLAVMAADRIDPAALEAALSGLARRFEPAWPAAGAVAVLPSPAHERKRLSRILDAPSNERLPTRCDKVRGQQRLS